MSAMRDRVASATTTNSQKLAVSSIFCAVAVVGSLFSFPILGSQCSPIQHMVNILCGVLLGPLYGLATAFVASLIRNLLGLGSLLAFPGSMFGALVCGVIYQKTKKIFLALLGEVCGTSILGGLCAYPMAILFMGRASHHLSFYAYVVPFLISTATGAIISGVLLYALKNSGRLHAMEESLNR